MLATPVTFRVTVKMCAPEGRGLCDTSYGKVPAWSVTFSFNQRPRPWHNMVISQLNGGSLFIAHCTGPSVGEGGRPSGPTQLISTTLFETWVLQLNGSEQKKDNYIHYTCYSRMQSYCRHPQFLLKCSD